MSPNSKGEVIVGFGDKITVIVDDVFRQHHEFHMNHVFTEIPEKHIKGNVDEKIDETKWHVQSVIFSKSSKLFSALVNDKYVVLWKRVPGSEHVYDTWDLFRKIGPLKENILIIDITPDDKYIIMLGVGGNVYCYSIETDLWDVVFSSVSLVLSMALSQSGDLIATGDRDGRVKITKFPKNFEIDSFCIGHKGAITDLMFSKKHLVSGSSDGFVKLWSLETSEYVDELDIASLIDMPKPYVQAIHHHCRDRRIVIVLKNLSKVVWFDYDKRGKIEQKFICDFPLKTTVISSCWDFHGLFWVGARESCLPISMFFIDLEMAKVFDVDVQQDHRYKALKKHLFQKINPLQYQNYLTSHKQLFIDRILPSN